MTEEGSVLDTVANNRRHNHPKIGSLLVGMRHETSVILDRSNESASVRALPVDDVILVSQKFKIVFETRRNG